MSASCLADDDDFFLPGSGHLVMWSIVGSYENQTKIERPKWGHKTEVHFRSWPIADIALCSIGPLFEFSLEPMIVRRWSAAVERARNRRV